MSDVEVVASQGQSATVDVRVIRAADNPLRSAIRRALGFPMTAAGPEESQHPLSRVVAREIQRRKEAERGDAG